MLQLKVGDVAPEFQGVNELGAAVKISDFRGKKLILYFYPKDDTPGCTAEACNLRDNYDMMLEKGYGVMGVSPDSAKKHQKFIEKFNLPFPLLADTEHGTAEAYGVWGEKKFMGKTYMGVSRTTFVINEEGLIEEIIDKVDTGNHTAQIVK